MKTTTKQTKNGFWTNLRNIKSADDWIWNNTIVNNEQHQTNMLVLYLWTEIMIKLLLYISVYNSSLQW